MKSVHNGKDYKMYEIIYEDVEPNEEYEKTIKIAIEEGYELHTILSFEEARESLDPLKSI